MFNINCFVTSYDNGNRNFPYICDRLFPDDMHENTYTDRQHFTCVSSGCFLRPRFFWYKPKITVTKENLKNSFIFALE